MILEPGGWIFSDPGAGRLDFSVILELGGWIFNDSGAGRLGHCFVEAWYQVVRSKSELSLQLGIVFSTSVAVWSQGTRRNLCGI